MLASILSADADALAWMSMVRMQSSRRPLAPGVWRPCSACCILCTPWLRFANKFAASRSGDRRAARDSTLSTQIASPTRIERARHHVARIVAASITPNTGERADGARRCGYNAPTRGPRISRRRRRWCGVCLEDDEAGVDAVRPPSAPTASATDDLRAALPLCASSPRDGLPVNHMLRDMITMLDDESVRVPPAPTTLPMRRDSRPRGRSAAHAARARRSPTAW